jgi:TetR/AcrR family transcriptional regulator
MSWFGVREGTILEKQEPEKRKRGRPRKSGLASENQAAEIFDVAVKLFAKQGFQETTMSQIATASGYDQSSLYYWFKDKNDLLGKIIENSEASLRVASKIVTLPGDKLVQLYVVLYSDVKMMCSSPFDFYDLEAIAHAQKDHLRSFFTTYHQLVDSIEQIVQQGMETGEFRRVEPLKVALDALSLNEGLQHRYHMNRKHSVSTNRMIGDDLQLLLGSIEDLAHHAARTTIKDLAPKCIPIEVHRQAKANNWI